MVCRRQGSRAGPLGAGSSRNNKEPLAGSHSDSLWQAENRCRSSAYHISTGTLG